MPRPRKGDAGDQAPSRSASVSETGSGIPDDAIGPQQHSVPELLELSGGDAVEAMTAKLEAEAAAHKSATAPRPPGKPDGRWNR
jgi:hypothetical protein